MRATDLTSMERLLSVICCMEECAYKLGWLSLGHRAAAIGMQVRHRDGESLGRGWAEGEMHKYVQHLG